jgi:hypothetical protein
MMEALAEDSRSLPVKDQVSLHFALANAYEDLGRYASAFRQLLAGNALQRQQIAYHEGATVGLFGRIRAVFDSELMRTHQNVGARSSKPVFIVGMPRSGTTLVEQILASHPQVFGAGELTTFADAVVSIGAVETWSEAFPQGCLTWLPARLRQLGARYLAQVERLAPDAARITDKMPWNYLHLGLIHLALPDAAIIHVVRNPLDTCVSCFSKLFAGGNDYSYDLAELGRYYRHYQALMAHWRDVLPPGSVLDVHYEDVVADLEGQARRIVAYCGLEWDARCVAFHQTERPVRTASMAEVRRPIYTSSVSRWRRYEALLGPLLAEIAPSVPSKAPGGSGVTHKPAPASAPTGP